MCLEKVLLMLCMLTWVAASVLTTCIAQFRADTAPAASPQHAERKRKIGDACFNRRPWMAPLTLACCMIIVLVCLDMVCNLG